MSNATTPTLDATISEASGKARLIEIHQLMTDFLRFQSHIQIPVYMDSLDWVENLEENEKEDHKKKLLRERQIIMMIVRVCSTSLTLLFLGLRISGRFSHM